MKGWRISALREGTTPRILPGPDMKILAVEDDAVARAVLRKALHRLGHEVVEAPDGEAAWAQLQAEPFRVVVSDWMMPHSDGLELCQRIRRRS